MTVSTRHLTLHTAAHFVVDFLCFYFLFGWFSPAMADTTETALGFLIYNVLAFGLQAPFGYLADEVRALRPAPLGLALLLCGLVCKSFPWLGMVLAALGNAFFHVGGGMDTLTRHPGRLGANGVFVSSGALGVTLGTLAGTSGLLPYPVALLLCAATLAALQLGTGRLDRPTAKGFAALGHPRWGAGAIILLCLLSVLVRSFVGTAVPITWKSGLFLTLLPALCAFVGKAAGGLLADRLGVRRVGVASLLLSLPLLVFGSESVLLCGIGLLLFNMTMSVTLCVLAGQLPANPGLGFGLTTLALLCGCVPSFFLRLPDGIWQPVTAVLILLSALCIFWAVGPQERSFTHDEKADELDEDKVL